MADSATVFVTKLWDGLSPSGRATLNRSVIDELINYRKALRPYSGSNYRKLSNLRDRESTAQMSLLQKLPRQNADAPSNPDWDEFRDAITGYAETAAAHDQIEKMTEIRERIFKGTMEAGELRCVGKRAIDTVNQSRGYIYSTDCSELISHSENAEAEAKKAYEDVEFGSEFEEIPPLDRKMARAFCLLRNPPTKEELNTIASEYASTQAILRISDYKQVQDSICLGHLVRAFASINTGISKLQPGSKSQQSAALDSGFL